MTGRPSSYTEDMADTICERLADGESLRAICSDPDMPARSSVLKWLRDHAEFSAQYARAREAQADAIFDEILDITDDGRNDWMARNGDDEREGWALNGEHVQRSRLRVDARKWMAAKLAPKKYSDKVNVEHGGEQKVVVEILKFD